MSGTVISVDLETFDKTPDSAIAAIGAVAEDGKEFYRAVLDEGGSFSPETIRWHVQQETAEDNLGVKDPIVPLDVALVDFSSWLLHFDAYMEGAVRMYAHASFDFPVLKMAYKRCGSSIPWHYRNTRDLRTLYDDAGGRPDLESEEKEHHALYDAKYQLRETLYCLNKLGRRD